MLEDHSRMSRWGNFSEVKCQCFYNCLGHRKEIKSVPCKEFKSGQTPRCFYTEKIKQRQTTQSCFHPRMFQELKNRDWDISRNKRKERYSREERGFLFLDLVLSINLNLECWFYLKNQTDISTLFIWSQILSSFYVPSTIVGTCNTAVNTRDKNSCPYGSYFEVGGGWGRNAYIHYTSYDELTLGS